MISRRDRDAAVKVSHYVREDLVHRLIAVDIQDQSACTVEPQEWLGLGGEHVESVCRDILRIVDPAPLTAACQQPPREFRQRDFEVHDSLQFDGRDFSRRSIRGLGLAEVARVAIEHIAPTAGCLNQRLREDLEYEVVGYQVPSPNVLDRLSSYLGICRNLLTQKLSARQVRDPVMVGELGCLRAFSGTGWGD